MVLPAAIIGALVSHRAPEAAIQIVYSLMMLAVAGLLLKAIGAGRSDHEGDEGCQNGQRREMTDARSGETHRFCATIDFDMGT